MNECEFYAGDGADCFTAGVAVVSSEGLCGPCTTRVFTVIRGRIEEVLDATEWDGWDGRRPLEDRIMRSLHG